MIVSVTPHESLYTWTGGRLEEGQGGKRRGGMENCGGTIK